MAEKKSFIDDATDVMINEVMPRAVKWLLDKVPEDKYEEIFQDKKKYWDIALPFFSFAVLRVTNSPKMVDDLTTEFFAEVRREINRRAEVEPEEEESEKDEEKKGKKPAGESFGIAYAKTSAGLRSALSNRINRLVSEEEKAALFRITLPPKDVQQIIKNLANCDESEFPELVSLLIPKKKQKTEPSKRVDAIAEMTKYSKLLKMFRELEEKKREAVLAHLYRLPTGQLAEHLQTLSKMDDPNFRLYIDTIMDRDRQRILSQAKEIGGGVLESFKKWREEDKKKPSLADSFRAGRDSRRRR